MPKIQFVDRLPLLPLAAGAGPDELSCAVALPILIAERSAPPPQRPSSFSPWKLDTGYTGRAYVWRSELRNLGLDPSRSLFRTSDATVSAFGESVRLWRRTAHLWLFGNVPGSEAWSFPLRLPHGIDVYDPAPSSGRVSPDRLPLVGMRLLQTC